MYRYVDTQIRIEQNKYKQMQIDLDRDRDRQRVNKGQIKDGEKRVEKGQIRNRWKKIARRRRIIYNTSTRHIQEVCKKQNTIEQNRVLN